jgi:hypothetical protein
MKPDKEALLAHFEPFLSKCSSNNLGKWEDYIESMAKIADSHERAIEEIRVVIDILGDF